jgi:Flp pilus assembly protein CpaB
VELEYSDKNSKRSKLYIAVGVIIALIVGGVVFVALRFSSVTDTTQAEMRSVVVAARDIASRKPIEEGDVVMRTVPADATNQQAYTRIDDVLGRISGVTITTGELITRSPRTPPGSRSRSSTPARPTTRRVRTCGPCRSPFRMTGRWPGRSRLDSGSTSS